MYELGVRTCGLWVCGRHGSVGCVRVFVMGYVRGICVDRLCIWLVVGHGYVFWVTCVVFVLLGCVYGWSWVMVTCCGLRV